ncbi:hypothetical protein IKH83_00285 [Candidatus Saccharibacteria bacterium]|nr:hypothetical protein [Candidatus Saccharibacteria bacterium]
MKIAFPEIRNSLITEATKLCPEVEAVQVDSVANGCALLEKGEVDGMIAGIDTTTRDVLLACRDHLTKTGKYFTSCFVLQKGDQTLILADGGVCKHPDAEMFTSIILETYETARKIFDEPRIALLSFSTFGSGGKDATIDVINEALAKVKSDHPEIIIDGEMQLDAAVNPAAAAKKCPDSPVAGRANVLICPDLNSGNILYKGLEQLGGWTAAGPILQGFKKPVADLSRGSGVEDVVLTIKVLEKLV